MNSLLREDTRQALYLIQQFLEKGIPLNDIYVEILAESMHRVGDLWHTARISVAEEHYCTSVTQMAMSQMYPQLFSSERKNRRILCACPGTELHEMGSRMVADLFENDGWDSTYLGAAVPVDAMLQSTGESSLAMVAEMPIDLLKLDRYFLVSAAHSKRHAEIIHFIIQLAQSLDLHILAEGVETKEQADYLLSSGCTFAQGYLYGKPMPAEEFLQKY